MSYNHCINLSPDSIKHGQSWHEIMIKTCLIETHSLRSLFICYPSLLLLLTGGSPVWVVGLPERSLDYSCKKKKKTCPCQGKNVMDSHGTPVSWVEDMDLVAYPPRQPPSLHGPCGFLYYTVDLAQKTGSELHFSTSFTQITVHYFSCNIL